MQEIPRDLVAEGISSTMGAVVQWRQPDDERGEGRS
jgi:hypothetical protein